MSWDVLLTGKTTPADLADADEFAAFVHVDEYLSREALLADAARFEAVVVQTYPIDEAFLEAADALEIVAKRGVGVDNIDIDAASAHGVLVANTPGANARAVAEQALGLLTAVRHRIVLEDRETRAGGWAREGFVTSELAGDTLGVFGAGNAGRTFAELAGGIGMDVIAYDPYVEDPPDGVERIDEKDDLFERADVVSVHAPLTDETEGAVGVAELEALGGILLNTARGGIVDEDALVAALEDGTLDGAGVDVYREEPPPEDHPLFALDSTVVTPHVAGWTEEANAAKNRGVVENLRTVYQGGVPESALNADALGGR